MKPGNKAAVFILAWAGFTVVMWGVRSFIGLDFVSFIDVAGRVSIVISMLAAASYTHRHQ